MKPKSAFERVRSALWQGGRVKSFPSHAASAGRAARMLGLTSLPIGFSFSWIRSLQALSAEDGACCRRRRHEQAKDEPATVNDDPQTHKRRMNSSFTRFRINPPLLKHAAVTLAWAIPLAVGSQPFALSDYLPYSPSVTSTLIASTESTVPDFELEIAGDSAEEFHWHATFPGFEGLKQDYRLTESGLFLLMESGTAPGSASLVYTQVYDPAWLIAPATVTSGQVVMSSASYSGSDIAEGPFDGTNSAALTIGGIESIQTPIGTFDALKTTFVSTWAEAGVGFTISGITTQTWWMAKSVGIVKLNYGGEETYTEDGQPPETDVVQQYFELQSHSLVHGGLLSIVILDTANARVTWNGIPGWSYQLQSNSNNGAWVDTPHAPVNGTGDPLSLDVPLTTESFVSFRLEADPGMP